MVHHERMLPACGILSKCAPRQKVAPSIAVRVSGVMETNKTKTVSRSESKRSTKRKAAPSGARAGTKAKRTPATAVGSARRNAAKRSRSVAKQRAEVDAQERVERIAVAAYFLAEQRAFAPNHELDDWLAAERSL
jgi:hypothetical protein